MLKDLLCNHVYIVLRLAEGNPECGTSCFDLWIEEDEQEILGTDPDEKYFVSGATPNECLDKLAHILIDNPLICKVRR